MSIITDIITFFTGTPSSTPIAPSSTPIAPMGGGPNIPLTGTLIGDTYPSLIKVGDNTPISSIMTPLTDGLGNELPMSMNDTTVNFTGNVDFTNATTVTGVVTQTNNLNVTLTDFTDPAIYYYGGVNEDEEWQINKWDNITGTKTVANTINNPTYTTLSTAWNDKLILNYI